MKDSKGWDGKLRVERHASLDNPEALEDPDASDEDAPPVEEIEADEGKQWPLLLSKRKFHQEADSYYTDLLNGVEDDVEVLTPPIIRILFSSVEFQCTNT